MATKVTLSSPSVQHSTLTNDFTNPDDLPAEVHYDTLSPNYTAKRPPTPPKSKQPSLSSWKQHRSSKYMESNDRQSLEPLQSSSNDMGKHTKNQEYTYHSQNSGDDLQQPPPLLQKQAPGHLDEFYILQEQMELTYRHRDQLLAENELLRYHLHGLQYRLHAMESMWYGGRKNQPSWASQQRQYRPAYLTPPYFMASSLNSHFEMANQPVLEQQRNDGAFRRQRSKSLPRNTSTSLGDDNGTLRQPFEFPPSQPRPTLPSHFQAPINTFETKRYRQPNNCNVNNQDSEDNSEDDNSMIQQNRHPRHHRYRTDDLSMPPYSNANVSMDPTDIPSADLYDFYSARDDDERWKQRSALQYYNNNDMRYQQFDHSTKYPRHLFYAGPQHGPRNN